MGEPGVSRIRALGQESAHLIATGQVIASLSGAVKELIENALDAKPRDIGRQLFTLPKSSSNNPIHFRSHRGREGRGPGGSSRLWPRHPARPGGLGGDEMTFDLLEVGGL